MSLLDYLIFINKIFVLIDFQYENKIWKMRKTLWVAVNVGDMSDEEDGEEGFVKQTSRKRQTFYNV